MHAPKLEDHGNTKKGGVVQTNASVFYEMWIYMCKRPWILHLLWESSPLMNSLMVKYYSRYPYKYSRHLQTFQVEKAALAQDNTNMPFLFKYVPNIYSAIYHHFFAAMM